MNYKEKLEEKEKEVKNIKKQLENLKVESNKWRNN